MQCYKLLIGGLKQSFLNWWYSTVLVSILQIAGYVEQGREGYVEPRL